MQQCFHPNKTFQPSDVPVCEFACRTDYDCSLSQSGTCTNKVCTDSVSAKLLSEQGQCPPDCFFPTGGDKCTQKRAGNWPCGDNNECLSGSCNGGVCTIPSNVPPCESPVSSFWAYVGDAPYDKEWNSTTRISQDQTSDWTHGVNMGLSLTGIKGLGTPSIGITDSTTFSQSKARDITTGTYVKIQNDCSDQWFCNNNPKLGCTASGGGMNPKCKPGGKLECVDDRGNPRSCTPNDGQCVHPWMYHYRWQAGVPGGGNPLGAFATVDTDSFLCSAQQIPDWAPRCPPQYCANPAYDPYCVFCSDDSWATDKSNVHVCHEGKNLLPNGWCDYSVIPNLPAGPENFSNRTFDDSGVV